MMWKWKIIRILVDLASGTRIFFVMLKEYLWKTKKKDVTDMKTMISLTRPDRSPAILDGNHISTINELRTGATEICYHGYPMLVIESSAQIMEKLGQSTARNIGI